MLILFIGYGLPERNPLDDDIVQIGGLVRRRRKTDLAASADMFGAGQTQQLLEQILQPVELRGHRPIGGLPRVGDGLGEIVGPQSHRCQGVSQLMRSVGDQASLPVERGPHHLRHGVERRREMAQLGRPRHVGRRTRDPFGHLGDGALEAVEWAKHPPGEGAGHDRCGDEYHKTTDCHPQPGSRYIACGGGSIDRQHDGTRQFAVLADPRGGEKTNAASTA